MWRFGVVAVCAVVVAGATPETATARERAVAQEPPQPSAVFNVPSGSPPEQNAIEHHLEELVDGTPRGALIRIAIYRFSSWSFTRRLIDAVRRGVDVQVVTDAGTLPHQAYRRVAEVLGTDRARSSWAIACHDGCIGDKIMHNKFFLFSRTGQDRDVVVQSSANLTERDRVAAWNNALTVSDPRLYQAYGGYFSALAARRHRPGDRTTRSGRITAYTFPRADSRAADDTLDRLLGDVDCAGVTPVDVAMFRLTRTSVARRLRSLARQGCDVRIAYTHLGARARRILAPDGGPRPRDGRHHHRVPETAALVRPYVHSKYVLIGGTAAGRPRPLVITGSPNTTYPALRDNDEAMLAVEDASVYRAYEENFDALWGTAARVGRTTGGERGAEDLAPRGHHPAPFSDSRRWAASSATVNAYMRRHARL